MREGGAGRMRGKERGALLDLLELAFGERALFARYLEHDPALRDEDTLVVRRGGRLVACLQLFTKRIRLADREVALGGVGSVATHPDWRGRGVASALVRGAEQEMRRRGMALGLLFAGPRGLYERLGWVRLPRPCLALRGGGGHGGRPFEARDLTAVRALYERSSARHVACTVRNASYWRGQLRTAGAPDEDFRLAERDGRLAAYARATTLFGARVAIEHAREEGGAPELADLLLSLVPADAALRVPRAGDRELVERLLERGGSLEERADGQPMWRVIDRAALPALEGGDAELIRALVGTPNAIYWPSDRF